MKANARPNLTEHEETALVFDFCELMGRRHEEFKTLFHIPNEGKRSLSAAAHMKREGLKSGVPDLFWPLPRCGYHGLWIEMKRREGGRLSKNQAEWIERLMKAGYCVRVCHGADEACGLIEDYYFERGKLL